MGLFLCSLFCPIEEVTVPPPGLHCLDYGSFRVNLTITQSESSPFVVLYQNHMRPVPFHKCQNRPVYVYKTLGGVLIGISSNLYINLGRMNSSPVWSLPLYDRKLSLYLDLFISVISGFVTFSIQILNLCFFRVYLFHFLWRNF